MAELGSILAGAGLLGIGYKWPSRQRGGVDDSADTWAVFVRELGHELNRRRHEAGLTQERLAYASGLTRYHYQQLEKGQSRPGAPANPSLRTVLALAQSLEVTLEDLLPDEVPDLTEGR